MHLQRQPLCIKCLENSLINSGGKTSAGMLETNKQKASLVVDHITPHKGDMTLFYDAANLQTLCFDHHNNYKKQKETIGYTSECDDEGYPIDPDHPINKCGLQ